MQTHRTASPASTPRPLSPGVFQIPFTHTYDTAQDSAPHRCGLGGHDGGRHSLKGSTWPGDATVGRLRAQRAGCTAKPDLVTARRSRLCLPRPRRRRAEARNPRRRNKPVSGSWLRTGPCRDGPAGLPHSVSCRGPDPTVHSSSSPVLSRDPDLCGLLCTSLALQ